MLDFILLLPYISRDAYNGKNMISSKPRSQMQVALRSWQKMDGPTVMTKSVVDGLIHGKNGDYESSVLDHGREKPAPRGTNWSLRPTRTSHGIEPSFD